MASITTYLKAQIDTLLAGKVGTSRQVAAGTGLTGGGALSSDRTLGISAGGVGATQLAADAVTAAKLAAGAVTPAKLSRSQPLAMGAINQNIPRATSDTGSTIAVSVVAGASTTSISGGVVGADLMASTAKVGLIGTTASKLVTLAGTKVSNWRVASDGTSGTLAWPTVEFGVAFWVSGTRYVEFNTACVSGPRCQVIVDDRPFHEPITPAWTASTTNTLKIDLGDTATHKVEFLMTNTGLARVWIEPAGSLWPADPRWPRLLVIGDSITAGATTHAGLGLGTWLPRFARLVGIKDYWNDGVGGSGPNLAPSGNYNNYQARATSDAIPAAPDIVIVEGWYNDKSASYTASQIATATGNTIDTLRAGLPNAQIIILGTPDPLGVNGPDFTAIDTAVKAVCATKGVPLILPTTGEVISAAGTTLFTAGPWFTEANKSLIVGGDNLHPTDLGQDLYAHRMREAWRAIMGVQ